MKRILAVLSVLALGACAASPPQAPVAAVTPCVANLSPPARKIFDAVQSGPTAGTLRDRISNQTRELVMEGEVTRSQARASAEAAADCLHGP